MNLHEPLDQWLTDAELAAIRTMRQFGADPLRDFRFWEALVCRILDGRPTGHSVAWDVELDHPRGAPIRVEVKHSVEFDCAFSNGTRPVFRFAKPKGKDGPPKDCDAIVLIGCDGEGEGDMHTWVLPPRAIKQCHSVTLTSPKHRKWNSDRSYPTDEFLCPPSQMLPEVLRASRANGRPYDHQHHQQNAWATRRSRSGNLELFA